MTTPPSENVSKLIKNGKEALKMVLDSHQNVTLRVLDIIPQRQRFYVYVLWTLSLLAFVAGSFFLYYECPTYAFVIYIIAFGCIMLSVIIQLGPKQTTPEQIGEIVKDQISGPSWARNVLKMPIEQGRLNDFQLQLRALRTQAIDFINKERNRLGRPDVSSDKVRINVFLTDTEHVADGDVCGLFIPKQMHDNMSDFEDRKIRFRPHEGLTGRTFTLGVAGGATASLSDQNYLNWTRINVFPQRPSPNEWERFVLSDQQKALIEKRLRWIASFPLPNKQELGDKPFGVLNIDGLDDSLTTDELCSLAGNMEPQVNGFASSLAQLPQVRIAIRVEDIPS